MQFSFKLQTLTEERSSVTGEYCVILPDVESHTQKAIHVSIWEWKAGRPGGWCAMRKAHHIDPSIMTWIGYKTILDGHCMDVAVMTSLCNVLQQLRVNKTLVHPILSSLTCT